MHTGPVLPDVRSTRAGGRRRRPARQDRSAVDRGAGRSATRSSPASPRPDRQGPRRRAGHGARRGPARRGARAACRCASWLLLGRRRRRELLARAAQPQRAWSAGLVLLLVAVGLLGSRGAPTRTRRPRRSEWIPLADVPRRRHPGARRADRGRDAAAAPPPTQTRRLIESAVDDLRARARSSTPRGRGGAGELELREPEDGETVVAAGLRPPRQHRHGRGGARDRRRAAGRRPCSTRATTPRPARRGRRSPSTR